GLEAAAKPVASTPPIEAPAAPATDDLLAHGVLLGLDAPLPAGALQTPSVAAPAVATPSVAVTSAAPTVVPPRPEHSSLIPTLLASSVLVDPEIQLDDSPPPSKARAAIASAAASTAPLRPTSTPVVEAAKAPLATAKSTVKPLAPASPTSRPVGVASVPAKPKGTPVSAPSAVASSAKKAVKPTVVPTRVAP